MDQSITVTATHVDSVLTGIMWTPFMDYISTDNSGVVSLRVYGGLSIYSVRPSP